MLLAAVQEALRFHAAQEHWSFYNSSSWYLRNTQENCEHPTVRRIDEAWIYWKSWKSSGYKDERAFMTGWQEQSLCNLSWPHRWPCVEQQIEQGDFLRFSLVPHPATSLSAILWHWETASGTRVFQLMGYTSLDWVRIQLCHCTAVLLALIFLNVIPGKTRLVFARHKEATCWDTAWGEAALGQRMHAFTMLVGTLAALQLEIWRKCSWLVPFWSAEKWREHCKLSL